VEEHRQGPQLDERDQDHDGGFGGELGDWTTRCRTLFFGAKAICGRPPTAAPRGTSIGDATFQGLSHIPSATSCCTPPTTQALVCSNQGLWRSDNGGTTFTQVQTGSWQELEMKPGDPTTVYAVKQTSNRTEFWRSTNNGVSFTQVA
jgi:hypothetical protein